MAQLAKSFLRAALLICVLGSGVDARANTLTLDFSGLGSAAQFVIVGNFPATDDATFGLIPITISLSFIGTTNIQPNSLAGYLGTVGVVGGVPIFISQDPISPLGTLQLKPCAFAGPGPGPCSPGPPVQLFGILYASQDFNVFEAGSFVSGFGGAVVTKVELTIVAPDGYSVVTPLPASLPLFASVIGALMLSKWARVRRIRDGS